MDRVDPDYVMRNWSMVRTGSTSSQKSLFFNLRRVQAKLEREAAERGERLDQFLAPAGRGGAWGSGVGCRDDGRSARLDYLLNATQSSDEDGREWIDALEDDGLQAAEVVEGAHDADLLVQLAVPRPAGAECAGTLYRWRAQA